ncbi:MAG: helix-turn-helix domain-containing protein [Deltaproteobacteria bacterium]|nr:helix-turn-helix domain-containing protein [Deltaproteobacteria bacterium]
MIKKHPINPQRARKIAGSFAFIEHRFLRNGFFTTLTHHELLLYVFLVLVADRNGLSYYSYDKICTLLRISVDEYIFARDSLIKKDLIAFDGYLFQVLSLPKKPFVDSCKALKSRKDMEKYDPATVGKLVAQSFGGSHD